MKKILVLVMVIFMSELSAQSPFENWNTLNIKGKNK